MTYLYIGRRNYCAVETLEKLTKMPFKTKNTDPKMCELICETDEEGKIRETVPIKIPLSVVSHSSMTMRDPTAHFLAKCATWCLI